MAEAIEERHGLDPADLPEEVLQSTRPLVLRGLVSDWPVVRAARSSDAELVEYLRRFDARRPVIFLTAPREAEGRFFYNEDLSGFNFERHRGLLGDTLDRILAASCEPEAPSIYMGSTMLDAYLPGLRERNPLALVDREQKLANIWIGTRTRIAAHQDLPSNLACVVAGERRFTLFPPDQLANLYIGPIDFTPAGQAISLVDFQQPDFERYPRFREALEHAHEAVLEPGDVLMIPSMWWHHVESLQAFNVLINYWWRDQPGFMDSPMTALMLSLLTIRDLPDEQRRIWQDIFHHYVFEPGQATHEHIPAAARRVLGPIDERIAHELRTQLLQRLKR